MNELFSPAGLTSQVLFCHKILICRVSAEFVYEKNINSPSYPANANDDTCKIVQGFMSKRLNEFRPFCQCLTDVCFRDPELTKHFNFLNLKFNPFLSLRILHNAEFLIHERHSVHIL